MPRRFFAWRWGYRGGSDMDLAPDVMDLAAKLTGNRTSRRFLPPNRPCRLASHSARDHDPLRRRRVRRGLNVQSLGERSHFAERFRRRNRPYRAARGKPPVRNVRFQSCTRSATKAEAKVYWSKRGQPCGEGHSLSCGTVPLRRRARKRALSKAVIVAAVVRKRAWKEGVNDAGHAVRRIAG